MTNLFQNVLLFCAINIFVFESLQISSYATDQLEWFGDRIQVGNLLIILGDEEIEEELSFTPEQRQTLADLENHHRLQLIQMGEKMMDQERKSDKRQKIDTKEFEAEMSALELENRHQIWKTLTVAQRERCYQILWQLNVARALSEDPNVISIMSLTAEQQTALRERLNQHEKDLNQFRQGRPGIIKIAKFVEAAETKLDDQAINILTEGQRTEWSKLIDRPVDVVALRSRVNPHTPSFIRDKIKAERKLNKKTTKIP